MKKTLLLGTVLMVGIAGYAQQNAKIKVRAGIKIENRLETKEKLKNKEQASSGASQKLGGNSHNSPSSTCPPSHVSSSYTSAGIFDWVTAGNASYRNLLTYNKDLNVMAFIHRNSADWKTDNGGTATAVGSIMSTWWPVGNLAAQDSMVIYHTLSSTNFHSARYPTGTLFNPPGNTTLSNAFMVASGVYTPDGTNFNAGSYYASRQPQGSYHNLPADNKNISATGKAPFGNVGGSVFSNGTFSGTMMHDMQQAGNKVVVAGPLFDPAITSGVYNKGAVIGIGTYDSEGDSLVWKADSITMGFYLTAPTATNNASGLGYATGFRTRVAFSPDGQTGYVVMIGRLSHDYMNSADSMVSPIVYKTTDGGTTWNPILQGYDWRVGHPELMRGVGLKAFATAPYHFAINDDPNGNDLTVDGNGVLHYVVTVQEVFTDGEVKDSMVAYSYGNTGHYDYIHHHPMIWDLMTDGNCWKTLLVDSINTNYISGSPTDTTNAYSRWAVAGTASSNEGMGANITVSRSTDGNIVFYGWGDSDPTGTGACPATGLVYNTDPDLVMKAYDINAHTMSTKKDMINGDVDVFQPYLSDISYSSGGNWVVPAIYVSQGRGTAGSGPVGTIYDINSGIDYTYIDCYSFSPAEIAAVPAVVYNDKVTTACVLGIKSNNSNAFASGITNYPNPFSNTTTISVTLSESKAVDVKVYNAIGTLVFSKKINGNVGENAVTFDGGALSSGVYYYTVTAGNEQATKKMVIQK